MQAPQQQRYAPGNLIGKEILDAVTQSPDEGKVGSCSLAQHDMQHAKRERRYIRVCMLALALLAGILLAAGFGYARCMVPVR